MRGGPQGPSDWQSVERGEGRRWRGPERPWWEEKGGGVSTRRWRPSLEMLFT